MKYNLARDSEARAAQDELTRLMEKKVVVDIKKVSPRRSLPQNNYLHLLIAAFATHFGYTIAEAKIIYKQVNADLYNYSKNSYGFQRSSAELSKEDMAKSIDVFRQYSADNDYRLPPADNPEWLRSVENAIEQAKYYL